MGLFNPHAVFLSDVNLLLQLAILVVLMVGFSLKRGRIYSKHGVTMAIAVALHSISIFAIMLPSLLALTGSWVNSLAVPLVVARILVVLPHAVLGSLVEILGVYLVLAWALHLREVKVCSGKKKFMKLTLILWLIELAIGVCAYILLYVLT